MIQERCFRRNYSFEMVSAILTAVLVLGFLHAPLQAQTPAAAGSDARLPAQLCPPHSRVDALLTLAQNCAKDLKGELNCRAHEKVEQRGVENVAQKEFVIVKDCALISKPEGYLLIPVEAYTGVDDPRLFSAPLDLWGDAWHWSGTYPPGQASSRIGLAINSKSTRGFPQLHIHISCVDPEVRTALKKKGNIPLYPAQPVPVANLGPHHDHTYSVVKVKGLTGKDSPFEVVRAEHAGDMEKQGIAVIGAEGKGEFYVLNTSETDTPGNNNQGHAEELLDQKCAKQ